MQEKQLLQDPGYVDTVDTCVTFNERFVQYFKLMYQGPMFQLKVGMLD